MPTYASDPSRAAVTRVENDIDVCRELWQSVMPSDVITDLWEVRDCFQRHFGNTACFLVEEDPDGIAALLPLSRIGETDALGFFPGETWRGKTWLEQNRIFSRDGVPRSLIEGIAGKHHIRYLSAPPSLADVEPVVDEIGYLFEPPRHNYDMESYFQAFSGKARRKLRKDIERLEAIGVDYRYDDTADFDIMVELNVGRFGSESYFRDPRFLGSFRSLMELLRDRGLMRITTVILGGIPAAVDLGAIYNGTYTLLAGGTHPDYPGVAKLINLHHMRFACERRLDSVDFLCGDFSWKKLFHLTPRPLYLLSNMPGANGDRATAGGELSGRDDS
ncbi:MAG: GNAT family N-acetyltransferase [Verrucomicrobia bacterium]|nr:GNAT family N-acetyltransferase [Verrucomicrobiota bacterium]